MLITRGFSLTNFIIGTSALSFQVFVLFPWHEKLDEEFHKLKADHTRLLEDVHKKHAEELRGIREKIDVLAEAQKRGGWRFF